MKIVAMSDLYLSKKPWQVRKAFATARDADPVSLAGDLVNDGTPEQFELMRKRISEVLPDTPVLAVASNHDYPAQSHDPGRSDRCHRCFPAYRSKIFFEKCPLAGDNSNGKVMYNQGIPGGFIDTKGIIFGT